MNHIVPDFQPDDDYLIPELPEKSIMGGDEDVMELQWQNGQVVIQSQNQRSVGYKKPETRPPLAGREIRSSVVEGETGPSTLFMEEDEMASWLHYPVDVNTFEGYLYSNDLLYPTPPSSAPITTDPSSLPRPPPPPPSVVIPSPRPPIPPIRPVELESGQPKYPNFMHFSRPNKIRSPESGPSNSNMLPDELRPSTVVASNETPAVETPESRASRVADKLTPVSAANVGCGGVGGGAVGASSAGREIETCDRSMTSSPGSSVSGASASVEPSAQKIPAPGDDRKRKGRDADDIECHSEDVEIEDSAVKKQSHGSTSMKRSRAAEVHNLSERRRRDRINEKMKALQELIPRCNKSDKASMLDEAIEYLKSLQMQVRMMSMGCNMVPMVFQQYMPPMGISMGMGMDMGMNRVMVPYPTVFPGSTTAHLGPRFPAPGFNIPPPVTATCPGTSQAANLSAPLMTSFPQVPNFVNPCQQYTGLHQTPLALPRNQGGMALIAMRPSSSKVPIDTEHHQIG